MRKPRSIFYIIYFLFHIGLLLVSIYVNYKSEDFEFLLKLRVRMDLMIYVAIAGLVLFFIDIMLITMEVRNHKKERERLEHEVNSLKAKMFDLQEATKSTPSQKELTKKEQNEDQE
ncbi:hypothetical protein GCM10009122_02440 [Fulvivirga kasyanovii]|uniref:Lipopolysaccharide assembly protein A domain-containing protein n=1 Tax=Fulvivirga kasyanovii TaxID=396812 RepID=A0ABW9RIV1_9BACT|nr:hypothetical protein [Fulvivirga kasyanovii]MTI23851.1 hypothetical protein [Fulvivirga kasyanovii]